MQTTGSRALWLALVLSLAGAGCATDPAGGDDDFPLSDLDSIYEDAPADRGVGLPEDDAKGDGTPVRFDLMDIATDVRSQGSRGTCTIFATIGLMEALYNREGTLTNPDFSEQFLQWSAKFEVRSFPNTSGSNPEYNLQAISRFGVVEESVWPYESSEWGPSNDPECTGDNRPTRCYTNGEPTEEMRAAQRFTLPRGRWINPRARSLQGHMLSTRTPVVVSGQFFYQAWNHGRSNLTTSSENSRRGIVMFPNAEDIADSSGERRAGHGVTLFGWDDEMEVIRVNPDGTPELDEEGNPVMERGFFLFKNSWGTGRFGVENPHGAGFGWISYRYVEEYLTAYTAGLPQVAVPEVCNDDRDNDRNGLSDCDDPACSGDHSCMDPVDDLVNTTPVVIPDNDPTGTTSSIVVNEGGLISSMAITVDLTHSYVGDLTMTLVREEDGLEVPLHSRSGGSADDLVFTRPLAEFNNTDAAGTYTLHIADHAAADTGTLNQWSLEITRCMGSECETAPQVRTYTDSEATAIPDNGSVSRTLAVSDTGEITALSVDIDIEHEASIDLTIRFGRDGGREFVLLTEDLSGDTHLQRTFEVPALVGEELAGEWTLTVVDAATNDVGTINSWSISATTR